MSTLIASEDFRSSVLEMLDEIFDSVHGYILDRGTSLFETLATVSADEASRPISSSSGSLAAQVNHVRFYIDMMNDVAKTGEQKELDWDSSWAVAPVTESEWQGLIEGLRASYQETRAFASTFDGWNADMIGGAIALIAHSAYHLGEIRQGLGVIRG